MSNNSYRVLIIAAVAESEELSLQLAQDGFAPPNISVFDNAFDTIRASLPDLILLTTQPGTSSISFTADASRQYPMVPIVMVAMDTNDASVREHISAGASDYIYYVGAEKALLGFVILQNLESHSNASVAAASVETIALFQQLERDQQAGFRVQQAMLPKSPASIQGLTFNHQLYPSMIMSGDFIDYFELFDGRVAFYIADVSGHGASSAFITVLLKSLSRRLLDEFQNFASTAEILNWFNSELLQWDLEQHVTMFFGVIDQDTSQLEYSNAAHFPGTILCQENGTKFLEIGGQPLGLYIEPTYAVHLMELPKQYSIVMFSDGVFEILPQKTLEDKEEHLLSLVECLPMKGLEALIDKLGVLSAKSIPDDIAVFTVANFG